MCFVDGSIDQLTSVCPMCRVFRPTAPRCPHKTETCRNRSLHPNVDVVHLTNAEVQTFNGCGYCKWARSNSNSPRPPLNPGWPGCCRPPTTQEYPLIPPADWHAISVVHRVHIPADIKQLLDSIRTQIPTPPGERRASLSASPKSNRDRDRDRDTSFSSPGSRITGSTSLSGSTIGTSSRTRATSNSVAPGTTGGSPQSPSRSLSGTSSLRNSSASTTHAHGSIPPSFLLAHTQSQPQTQLLQASASSASGLCNPNHTSTITSPTYPDTSAQQTQVQTQAGSASVNSTNSLGSSFGSGAGNGNGNGSAIGSSISIGPGVSSHITMTPTRSISSGSALGSASIGGSSSLSSPPSSIRRYTAEGGALAASLGIHRSSSGRSLLTSTSFLASGENGNGDSDSLLPAAVIAASFGAGSGKRRGSSASSVANGGSPPQGPVKGTTTPRSVAKALNLKNAGNSSVEELSIGVNLALNLGSSNTTATTTSTPSPPKSTRTTPPSSNTGIAAVVLSENESSTSSSSESSSESGTLTSTSSGGFTDYLSDESEAELQRQAEARAAVLEQNRMEEQEFRIARQQLAGVDLRPPRSWNPGAHTVGGGVRAGVGMGYGRLR